jgi:hypothetical protein
MANAETASTALAGARAKPRERIVDDAVAAPFCKASDLMPGSGSLWEVWQHLSPHPLATVLHPQYFRNRIGQLRPAAVIEVQDLNRTYYAKLLVRAVDPVAKAISVVILEEHKFGDRPIVRPDYSKCRIEARDGPAGKQVVVIYGKTILGTFQTKEQAESYLAEQTRLAA